MRGPRVGEGALASVHKKASSPWVSNHFAFICLLMPNSKWTEACHNEVPLFFSKQPDFIFLIFRLAKRKKKNAEDCSSIECNYGRLLLFFFNYWLFLRSSVIFQEFFFYVERSSGKAAGIILSLWLIVHNESSQCNSNTTTCSLAVIPFSSYTYKAIFQINEVMSSLFQPL